MHDAVAVALEGGPKFMTLLLVDAAAGGGAALRAGGEVPALASLQIEAAARHDSTCHFHGGDSTESLPDIRREGMGEL